MLQPAGYRALRVATAAAARERARSARPDFIIIITPLPGENGLELCEALRRDPSITPAAPIIGVVTGALPRELYMRWLRAGAWDCLALPLDVEQLLLRLGNYLRAKREADRVEEALLLDPATGLYNARGLKRRARELVAEAVRLHAALACVVFGLDPQPDARGSEPSTVGSAAVRDRVGLVLRTHGRISDTIGWWVGEELAVLAPATDADGTVKLAQRLVHALGTAPPEGGVSLGALEVRAGYEAVADIHAAPPEPEDLLAHASAALQRARAGDGGERIRRFQSSGEP